MPASYPTNVASFPTRLDNQVIDNSHMNSVQEEVVAIESTLGTGLKTKATGSYDAVTSSFASLSSRLDNIERGVASTDASVHPQYLPKAGGTIQPTAGDVVSLVVRQSPDASGEVFQVKSSTGLNEYFSVHQDMSTNAYGRLIVGKGIDSTTNADLVRNLRLLSTSGYSGNVLESIKGTSTTASLSASGNLTLAGNITVAGTMTVGSVAGFPHTHESDAQGGRVLPAGTLIPWLGSGAIPDGWLLCDGSLVLRTSYAQLFAAIGTAFGAGNGSTNFQLPDMRGRVPMGIDATQPAYDALGDVGGFAASSGDSLKYAAVRYLVKT